MKKFIIRTYMDEYFYYDYNKFVWDIYKDPYDGFKNFRMRKAPDNDILPDFSSVEKDAIRFKLYDVKFTDIFGIIWEGKRGVNVGSGAPDYEQHLYYYDETDSSNDNIYEENYLISKKYTRTKYPSFYDGYIKVKFHYDDGYCYHYIKDFIDVNYEYHVCNHLFKYTSIKISFENNDNELIIGCDGDNYLEILKYLSYIKRDDLIKKIYCQMNEHFKKLKNSDKEEVRKYYPNKTAEEIFVLDETK